MPIWLRRFTFEKLKEHYEKEQEQINKSNKNLKNPSSKEILRPGVTPSGAYNTPMPTKK